MPECQCLYPILGARPPYAVGNGSRAGTLLVRYFGVPDRGRLSLHWEVAAIGPLQPKFWKVAELLLADSSRFARLIPSNARWPRTESASLKTLGRWVFGATWSYPEKIKHAPEELVSRDSSLEVAGCGVPRSSQRHNTNACNV